MGAGSNPRTSSISSAKPAGQPPAFAGKDHPERFALGLVGLLVNEEGRNRVLGLAGPDVPLEGAVHLQTSNQSPFRCH
jgi:hypothetical protein